MPNMPQSIYEQIFTGGPLTIKGARVSDEVLISLAERWEETFPRTKSKVDIVTVTRDIARGR